MIVNDLLFGEPIYDENNKIIHRNFGVRNFIIWGIILYFIMNQSHGKQRGGGNTLSELSAMIGVKPPDWVDKRSPVAFGDSRDPDFSGSVSLVARVLRAVRRNIKPFSIILTAMIVVGGIAFLIINRMDPSFTKNVIKKLKKII